MKKEATEDSTEIKEEGIQNEGGRKEEGSQKNGVEDDLLKQKIYNEEKVQDEDDDEDDHGSTTSFKIMKVPTTVSCLPLLYQAKPRESELYFKSYEEIYYHSKRKDKKETTIFIDDVKNIVLGQNTVEADPP